MRENEYLPTAALPTLEALTGHVSCTTASLAQARLLSTLILMYLQRRLNRSRAKKQALLEEDYLISMQETAVDCDRRGAEWRKRQEHWQVPFVADCWLLSFLLLFWADCVRTDLAKFSLQLLCHLLSVRPADIARFHELLRLWVPGWPQHLLS